MHITSSILYPSLKTNAMDGRRRRFREVKLCRFKMDGRRRQKGERLIITETLVELTSKGKG